VAHAKVFSATTLGVKAFLIEVEVDLSFGLVNFCIVGLPDKAIKESKDRIRAAFKNCGLRIPDRLVTVNLAPANLKKQDSLFDVPIAVALLQAAQLVKLEKAFLEETVFLGELALDGQIRPIIGTVSIVHGIKDFGKKRVVLPAANVFEACLIEGIEVIPVDNLVQLVGWLRGEVQITPAIIDVKKLLAVQQRMLDDFSQVKGQRQAKRALQLAAAGWHNTLFIGSPGGGKTMLAKRLPTILPTLQFAEVLETTKIYSVAGKFSQDNLMYVRPFRSPHHTISQVGLVGGGSNPQPGEISLAHNGVLFLDELTEFSRTTVEALRQPLEDKVVHISRAHYSVEFPASFLLVAALNPCPCGFHGDEAKKCSCSQQVIEKYLGKLSGPLIDRIDVHVRVASLTYDELKHGAVVEKTSAEMKVEVDRAREFRILRQGETPNGLLSAEQIEKYCVLTVQAEQLVKKMFDRLGLSMRSYHKILKLARTIADFESSEQIQETHLREAFSYRCFDRQKAV
jgi:magnesium chelatase family protein